LASCTRCRCVSCGGDRLGLVLVARGSVVGRCSGSRGLGVGSSGQGHLHRALVAAVLGVRVACVQAAAGSSRGVSAGTRRAPTDMPELPAAGAVVAGCAAQHASGHQAVWKGAAAHLSGEELQPRVIMSWGRSVR
jgi:hypothetical protein